MSAPASDGDSLEAGSVAAPSKWSFNPIQSIPRNAEALWNLMDTVYFANIPPGHDLLECLKQELVPLPELEGLQGCLLTEFAGESQVRFSYQVVQEESKALDVEMKQVKVEEVGGDTGPPSVTALSSSVATPFIRIIAHKPKSSGGSLELLSANRILPIGSRNPVLPKWECISGEQSSSCSSHPSTSSAGLSLLQAELLRVNRRKTEMLKQILARIEKDERPPRRQWFEAEQLLLSYYERKPPSSFQSTVAAAAAGESQPGGLDNTHVSLPLSKLGKIDTSLPDSDKDLELCCCVCGEGDTTEDNDIIICDGCSFAAHQHCYFVEEVPEGNWYCQLCESNSRKGSGNRAPQIKKEIEPAKCVLCLQSSSHLGGGLMKPVESGGWGHVRCATWVPEAAFPKDGRSISLLPNKSREELRCSVCKLKGGSPVQCAFGKCTTAFHISCAALAGLLPEERNLKNLYCTRHIKIQLKTSPATSRLLSLRKLDHYQKFVMDKFVAPKIGSFLLSPTFNGEFDGTQNFWLKIAAFHPFVVQACAKTNVCSVADLLEESPQIEDLESTVIIQPEHFNQSTLADLRVCSECMRPVDELTDIVLKCETCQLLCHASCYETCGLPALNVNELTSAAAQSVYKPARDVVKKYGGQSTGKPVSIQCHRCMYVSGQLSQKILRKTFCVLCMQLGGVLVPVGNEDTISGGDSTSSSCSLWAHPRCLYWLLPSASLDPCFLVGPPFQLKSISSTYHFRECKVCRSSLGCTVKCSRPYCDTAFHVSCGFHAGCGFTVRGAGTIVAGSRGTDLESEIFDNLKDIVRGDSSYRRTITCWAHEQKGTKRGLVQLDRSKHIVREICRWIPEGVRSDLVDALNKVLLGPAETEPTSIDGGSGRIITRTKPTRTKRNRADEILSDGASSDSDSLAIVPTSKRQRIRREAKQKTESLSAVPITTVRFVDGMEVTCEDEDWEGSCSLCRKPWTDSKGQMLESIACDKCDQWFHFHCVGIESAPAGEFVCPLCRAG